MTIEDLEDNDPVFYDYLVDEIFEGKDLSPQQLANKFDLPISIILKILKNGVK